MDNKELAINRAKQLMGILQPINESKKNTQSKLLKETVKKAGDGKIYGLVREGSFYFIKSAIPAGKKSINESDFMYLGGLQNNIKFRYNNFNKALESLNTRVATINETYDMPDEEEMEGDEVLETYFMDEEEQDPNAPAPAPAPAPDPNTQPVDDSQVPPPPPADGQAPAPTDDTQAPPPPPADGTEEAPAEDGMGTEEAPAPEQNPNEGQIQFSSQEAAGKIQNIINNTNFEEKLTEKLSLLKSVLSHLENVGFAGTEQTEVEQLKTKFAGLFQSQEQQAESIKKAKKKKMLEQKLSSLIKNKKDLDPKFKKMLEALETKLAKKPLHERKKLMKKLLF